MEIRPYQPGDEHAQAAIYNAEAGGLPAFKPASADEVAWRLGAIEPDPNTRWYAIDAGRVVGYCVLSPTGRISYPWCLPGHEAAREPLLDAVLNVLRDQGAREAWAAYRADWTPVLRFFHEHGFPTVREMINYHAPLDRLPRAQTTPGHELRPLEGADLPELLALGGTLFEHESAADLERFFWSSPYLEPGAAFVLRSVATGALVGAGVAVIREGYADPGSVNPAMPCFRLGAFGTERERHKRVNGLVSVVFAEAAAGEALLAEAAARLARAGVHHAAAQAPSDQPALCAFYDRFFVQQGRFPIVSRPVAAAGASRSAARAGASHGKR